MSKPIIRYIELTNGRCGLSIETALQIRREEGSRNVKNITNATAKQVEWVRGMGGLVPDGRIVKEKAAPK